MPTRTRRQIALLVAIGATVYLWVAAAAVVILAVWRSSTVLNVDSAIPIHVLALMAAGLLIQLGITIAWVRTPTLRRLYVGLAAVVEIVLGIAIYMLAPIMRGGGPAPRPGEPAVVLTPAWMFWGLLCLSVVGLLMIVAVVMHGSQSRQSARAGRA